MSVAETDDVHKLADRRRGVKLALDGVCCDWLLWDQLGSNDARGGVVRGCWRGQLTLFTKTPTTQPAWLPPKHRWKCPPASASQLADVDVALV